MPLLRGNLHAHTTHSDGIRPPARLVEEYERLGHDFLAITDHEDHANLHYPDYEREIATLASRLLVFRGLELDFRPLSQHVGCVSGDRERLYVLNHPARYKLSVEETLTRMRVIAASGLSLDAVEVTDTGFYRALYDTPEIPLVKVATDDAHRPPQFGRAWIEVEARRDRDAIIRAIRGRDCRVVIAAAEPVPE